MEWDVTDMWQLRVLCGCYHRCAGHGAAPPHIIFQIVIFGQKASNIRAKPLDFRASNGKNNIQAKGQKTSAPLPRTKLVPCAHGACYGVLELSRSSEHCYGAITP